MNRYCIHCMSIIGENEMVCPKCGNSQQIDIPGHVLYPGILLNNRYIVGKVLGEGGFGITYIGRDTNLDRIVAIKEYYPTGYVNRSNTTSLQVISNTQDKESFDHGCDKFLSEARMLAKFSNEDGIVSVIDFFKENGTAYIIMEYLDGFTLKDYLDQKGRLTVEETMLILTPIITSLQKIHQQGLIHRDISPSNIMIANGKIKLIDFGSARNFSNNNKSLSLMLKPGFAPEEQYRSKGVQGPWTDVYALCATIYLCITGIIPEEANDRTYNDELKTPSSIHIHISNQFEKALMKGLAVFSNDRYQSIKELLDGLNGISTKNYEEKPTYVPQDSGQEGGLSFGKREDDKATTIVNDTDAVHEETVIKEKQRSDSEIITPPVNTKKTKKHHFGPIIIGLSLVAVLIVTGVILAASGVFNSNNDSNEKNTNSQININTSKNEISEEQQSLSAINISFDTNGSTTINDAVVAFGDTFGNLPVPEKEGYVFKGWSYVNVNHYSTQFLHNTNIYFLAPEAWGDSPIIYCHLWNSQAEDPLYPWQSEQQECTHISDRIYRYTIPAGANVDCVLFSSSEGYQTYDVAIGTICENDLLYCVRKIPNSDFLFEGAWSINRELGPIPSTWFEDVSLINPIIDLDKIVVNDYNYVNSDSKVVCPEDHTIYAVWEQNSDVALTNEMGDNLYDYKIMIDKDVYTLPMKYSDFISYGWKPENGFDEDAVLEAGQRITIQCYKGNYWIIVSLYNFYNNNRVVTDCHVVGFEISSGKILGNKNPYNQEGTIKLPKGICLRESGLEEIKAAYGEPSEITNSFGTCLTYTTKVDYLNNSIVLTLNKETGLLETIKIAHQTVSDDYVDNYTPTTVPQAAKDYAAPKELGTEITSGIVKFYGDLYQLPAPLSAFIKNGWTIENSTSDYIAANSYSYVTIARNGVFENIAVNNHESDSIQIKHGLVEKLTFLYSNINHLLSPEEIKEKSEQLTKDAEKAKNDYALPNDICLTISESELLEKINNIEFFHDDGTVNIYYIPIEKYTEEELKSSVFISMLPKECSDYKKYIKICIYNDETDFWINDYVAEIDVVMSEK